MALHYGENRHIEMLAESLREMLLAAHQCLQYKKEDGGCLGYPAALLLFSIIDSIGSYHVGSGLVVDIDGKTRRIDGGGSKHFFILNSDYFDWQLSLGDIETIYQNYRSLLTHNAMMADGHFISRDHPLRIPYDREGLKDEKNNISLPVLYLIPTLRSCNLALGKFLKSIGDIVPQSVQLGIIKKKRAR